MNHWLIKSEPDVFSIHDLAEARRRTTRWEGVRNYQARNFLRAMRKGDLALFYHSNAAPSAVAGVVEVVREAYPDESAWDAASDYHDPKASPDNPIWSMVNVKLVAIFPRERGCGCRSRAGRRVKLGRLPGRHGLALTPSQFLYQCS